MKRPIPLQTLLGLQFGLSQGRANLWIHRLLPLVREALAKLNLAPDGDGQAVADSAVAQEGGADCSSRAPSAADSAPKTLKPQEGSTAGSRNPTPTKTGYWSTVTARKSPIS